MDNKTVSLFSFLFLFLMAMSSIKAEPYFSNESLIVANSSEYSPNITDTANHYGFQIKINDTATDSNVSEITGVNFENNFNGTTWNATPTNNTNGIFWVNFSYITNISATETSYTYTWYADNTTDGNENSTSSTYYIAKNTSVPVRMNMTVYAHGGTQTNHTDSNARSIEGQGLPYVDSWMRWTNGTNFMDAITNTIGTTACFRDGVSWTKGSSGATSLGIGSYTVKCNSTGNANYTSNSTGASYTLSVISSGGGGGGEPLPTTTTQKPFVIQPTEEWQLPELDQNTIIILVIIGIVILASRKKK